MHVGCLVEGGVVGSHGCRDGFDVQEEEAVELGDGGGTCASARSYNLC